MDEAFEVIFWAMAGAYLGSEGYSLWEIVGIVVFVQFIARFFRKALRYE